jgi:hypothetical protein
MPEDPGTNKNDMFISTNRGVTLYKNFVVSVTGDCKEKRLTPFPPMLNAHNRGGHAAGAGSGARNEPLRFDDVFAVAPDDFTKAIGCRQIALIRVEPVSGRPKGRRSLGTAG